MYLEVSNENFLHHTRSIYILKNILIMAPKMVKKVRDKVVRRAKKCRDAFAKIGGRELPDLVGAQSSSHLNSPRRSAISMQQRRRTPNLNRTSPPRGTLAVRNPDAPQISRDSQPLVQNQGSRVHVLEAALADTESRGPTNADNRHSWTDSLKTGSSKTTAIASRFITGLVSDKNPIVPEELISIGAQLPPSSKEAHSLSFSRRVARLASSSETSLNPSHPGLIDIPSVDLAGQLPLQGPGSRYPSFRNSESLGPGQRSATQNQQPGFGVVSSTSNEVRAQAKPSKYKAYRTSTPYQAHDTILRTVSSRLPPPLRIGEMSTAPQPPHPRTQAERSLFFSSPDVLRPVRRLDRSGTGQPEYQSTFEAKEGHKREKAVKVEGPLTSRDASDTYDAWVSYDAWATEQKKKQQIAEERKAMYEKLSSALEDFGNFKVEF